MKTHRALLGLRPIILRKSPAIAAPAALMHHLALLAPKRLVDLVFTLTSEEHLDCHITNSLIKVDVVHFNTCLCFVVRHAMPVYTSQRRI